MQFDRHPDAIAVSIVAMPRVVEGTVVADRKEWVVGKARRHQDIFVHRVLIVLPKLLHVTRAQHLGVNFQKLVSRVDSAIGLLRGVPEVQFEPVSPRAKVKPESRE